jgi:group II intron reverse transcriptase/maturase
MATEQAKKKAKLRYAEYYDFQEIQDKLYADSGKGKIFNKLIEIIILPENIRLAYRNIKKNHGSQTPGTDNKTIKDLEKLSDEQIVSLIQRKFSWYVPQSVRRVEIPKDNGKTRPLGIPTITDRLIQQCVLQVLEPICEAKFHDHSYGFRPNRSQQHAIAQVHKNMQLSHLHYVVDIDIKGFFDNVNHGKLLKQLWTLGIRDKKLISIISAMLKAEVAGVGFPKVGTPQGGIISPLLSNVVLNELDWWLASQWEEIPTQYPFRLHPNPNGVPNKGNKFESLRRSRLKTVTCVRYADDFKIFTNSYRNAIKLFHATENWLKDRLGLNISPEKSKVINLKEQYSEFLGFKLKVVKRGKITRGANKGKPKYVVESHVREKSMDKIKSKLDKLIYAIEYPQNIKHSEYEEIGKYNSFVIGVHQYYCMATKSSYDFRKLAFQVHKSLKARLQKRIKTAKMVRKKKIQLHTANVIKVRYGKSEQLRYVSGIALAPIGYVKHEYPMARKAVVNSYTEKGREEIHKNLEKVNMSILHYLMRNPVANRSVEYNDNRLSLYSAQMGKCAVTGKVMGIGDIYCHHKVPKHLGGTDKYQNLLLVCGNVHRLIHAVNPDTIAKIAEKLNLDQKQSKKLQHLRSLVTVENYQNEASIYL